MFNIADAIEKAKKLSEMLHRINRLVEKKEKMREIIYESVSLAEIIGMEDISSDFSAHIDLPTPTPAKIIVEDSVKTVYATKIVITVNGPYLYFNIIYYRDMNHRYSGIDPDRYSVRVDMRGDAVYRVLEILMLIHLNWDIISNGLPKAISKMEKDVARLEKLANMCKTVLALEKMVNK